ncbi:unnamed protein product, partial [Polarella glacialis]
APSANALPLSSGPPLQSGFRRMEIVEASDDSDQEIDDPASAKSQPPSPSVNVEKASAKSQPPSPSAKVEKAPAADDANKVGALCMFHTQKLGHPIDKVLLIVCFFCCNPTGSRSSSSIVNHCWLCASNQ